MLIVDKSDILYLIAKYYRLHIDAENPESFEISGSIHINKVYNNFPVDKIYDIRIIIFKDCPNTLPKIYEIGGLIDKDYSHKFSDDTLCLASSIEISIDFLEGMNLVQWIERYVVSYFYSYEYYMRFAEFPFGERSHGWGHLEFLADYFEMESRIEAFRFLSNICNKPYRGHLLCPCNSGKVFRKCHGDKVLKLHKLGMISRLKNYYKILSEVKKQDELNNNKTK